MFSFFQRITGPTYPLRGSIDIEGRTIRFRFPRSCTIEKDCKIYFAGKIDGYILYKKYKIDEEYTKLDFVYDGKMSYVNLNINLPKASKIEYDVFVKKSGYVKINAKPVVLRFKGYVPSYLLVPHIIFMYLFLFLSTYIFFELNFTNRLNKNIFYISLFVFLLGGFVFGPIVQYYAFEKIWSGFPYGDDLTDNKTLITLLIWIFPIYSLKKNRSIKNSFNLAYFLTTLVYIIPHSVLGSEYRFK
jgi:hypothetical protein